MAITFPQTNSDCQNPAKKARGFTLVEALIYVAMLSSAVVIFASLGDELLMLHVKAQSRRAVGSDLSFLMDQAKSRIRSAISISEPAVGATSTSVKYIAAPGGEENSIMLSDGIVYISVGAGTPQPLTSGSVEITRFEVERLDDHADRDNLIIRSEGRYRQGGSQPFSFQQSLETAVMTRE